MTSHPGLKVSDQRRRGEPKSPWKGLVGCLQARRSDWTSSDKTTIQELNLAPTAASERPASIETWPSRCKIIFSRPNASWMTRWHSVDLVGCGAQGHEGSADVPPSTRSNVGSFVNILCWIPVDLVRSYFCQRGKRRRSSGSDQVRVLGLTRRTRRCDRRAMRDHARVDSGDHQTPPPHPW